MFGSLLVGLSLPFFRELKSHCLSRSCSIIAKYSYGVYLSHYFCIWFAFQELGAMPATIRLITFLVLLVGAPFLLYHLIELPMIQLGNRIAQRLSSSGGHGSSVLELGASARRPDRGIMPVPARTASPNGHAYRSRVITLYSFDYPPNHGGVSRLCAEIAAGMDRMGEGVRVLTQSSGIAKGSRVPEVFEVRVTPRRPWRELQALNLLCEGGRGQPVVCGAWYPEGLIATLAAARPRVILAHGSELMPTTARWRRGLWRRLQRKVLTSADLVVANSEYTRRLVLSSAPGSRAVAIPLAVDDFRFSPGDRSVCRAKWGLSDQFVLCSVSRLHAYKGHEIVFRALAGLPASERNRLIYLVAGRGPDQARLQSRAQDLGVDSSIRWLGYVAEDDLPDLYRASDLFVLCTREDLAASEVEGFGLVFLEAQACGTPVVGVRAGGIPDAIDHDDGGWLIDADDAPALMRLILHLARDPGLLRQAGMAARARIERQCTWDHYLQRFNAALNAEGISLG